jgi:hypothetical protein
MHIGVGMASPGAVNEETMMVKPGAGNADALSPESCSVPQSAVTIDPVELYQEMREACARVVESHGMSREHFNWAALISLVQVRNGIIREAYAVERVPGETDAKKEELGKRHGVSVDYINRIVYGK